MISSSLIGVLQPSTPVAAVPQLTSTAAAQNTTMYPFDAGALVSDLAPVREAKLLDVWSAREPLVPVLGSSVHVSEPSFEWEIMHACIHVAVGARALSNHCSVTAKFGLLHLSQMKHMPDNIKVSTVCTQAPRTSSPWDDVSASLCAEIPRYDALQRRIRCFPAHIYARGPHAWKSASGRDAVIKHLGGSVSGLSSAWSASDPNQGWYASETLQFPKAVGGRSMTVVAAR